MRFGRSLKYTIGHSPFAILLFLAVSADAGSIVATMKTDNPAAVTHVWAIQIKATDEGTYPQKPVAGKIQGDKVAFDNLPCPGKYDLRFEVAGGTVEGWDATVPASDYVVEQPLSNDARKAICEKMKRDAFTGFDNDVVVLDIQGNAQHAALLVRHLRTTPFVGGGYKQGEWVWRASRYEWETADEVTWVPLQERPSYALVRERLYEKDYQAKRIVYSRQIGGITLSADKPEVDLGIILLPTPRNGIMAINPDGTATTPVPLKGPGLPAEPATQPSP